MPILYENFESYNVGDFTIANFDNYFNLGTVTAGGMAGGTRGFSQGSDYLRTSSGVTGNLTSLSVWWWGGLIAAPGAYTPLTLINYPSETNLLAIAVEDDQTLGLVLGGTNVAFSTSPIEGGQDFYQVNASFTDVGGFVHVTGTAARNGVVVMSGAVTTTIVTTNLNAGIASANGVVFNGPGNFTAQVLDEITIDTLTTIPSFPNPGTPKARISQAVNEPVLLPTDAKVRVSQGVNELVELPNSASVRISQGVIELVLKRGTWVVTES